MRTAIAIILLALAAMPVYGSEHCITYKGVEYCKDGTMDEAKTEVIIGNTKVKIKDPFSLLDKADDKQTNKITKVSLWEEYYYPPFIVELAKQNNMGAQELIDILAKEDITPNPWKTLKELEVLYPEIVSVYGKEVVDSSIDKVVTYIIEDVLSQIRTKVAGIG